MDVLVHALGPSLQSVDQRRKLPRDGAQVDFFLALSTTDDIILSGLPDTSMAGCAMPTRLRFFSTGRAARMKNPAPRPSRRTAPGVPA